MFKLINCCYNLWAKKYQVPPGRYSPPPQKKIQIVQPPENIPPKNYPAPLISRGLIPCSTPTYNSNPTIKHGKLVD